MSGIFIYHFLSPSLLGYVWHVSRHFKTLKMPALNYFFKKTKCVNQMRKEPFDILIHIALCTILIIASETTIAVEKGATENKRCQI